MGSFWRRGIFRQREWCISSRTKLERGVQEEADGEERSSWSGRWRLVVPVSLSERGTAPATASTTSAACLLCFSLSARLFRGISWRLSVALRGCSEGHGALQAFVSPSHIAYGAFKQWLQHICICQRVATATCSSAICISHRQPQGVFTSAVLLMGAWSM